MKKLPMKFVTVLSIALLGLGGFTAWAACTASPTLCDETVTVTVPSGGSCIPFETDCSASARSFEANGDLYRWKTVKCFGCCTER